MDQTHTSNFIVSCDGGRLLDSYQATLAVSLGVLGTLGSHQLIHNVTNIAMADGSLSKLHQHIFCVCRDRAAYVGTELAYVGTVIVYEFVHLRSVGEHLGLFWRPLVGVWGTTCRCVGSFGECWEPLWECGGPSVR